MRATYKERRQQKAARRFHVSASARITAAEQKQKISVAHKTSIAQDHCVLGFGCERLFTCNLAATVHVCAMPTNFSLFRVRFAEACLARGMKPETVYRSIGIGGRRALDLETVGVLRALDLHRVCQIADRLNVSLDWLLGRSDAMELPQTKNSKHA